MASIRSQLPRIVGNDIAEQGTSSSLSNCNLDASGLDETECSSRPFHPCCHHYRHPSSTRLRPLIEPPSQIPKSCHGTNILTLAPSSAKLVSTLFCASLLQSCRGRRCRRRPSGRWCPPLRKVGVSILSGSFRHNTTAHKPAGTWRNGEPTAAEV